MTDAQETQTKSLTQPERAARWWRELTRNTREKEDGAPMRQPNPGALARLRRCSRPIEAATEPACIDLYRLLYRGDRPDTTRLERISVLAILLAQLRSEPSDPISLPARLGRTKDGKIPSDKEMPVFSAGRLRALIRAQDPEAVLRGFRNIIAILGRDNISPAQLARYALFWLDPKYGERSRIAFLFAYHQAGDATPEGSQDAQDKNTAETPS